VLEVLLGFVEELRALGVPVSLTEAIDAAASLRHVRLARRAELRGALAATLVKSAEHLAAFERAFDAYFSPAPDAGRRLACAAPGGGAEDLAPAVRRALASGEAAELAALARLAVALAGLEPGRPVGPSYYVDRALRVLDLDGALAFLRAAGRLDDALARLEADLGSLGARLRVEELRRRAATLRRLVEDEVRRALVAERGGAALARELRRPLLADVDFAHASAQELAAMRRAVAPLARALAARLARRRRHARLGPLDYRATIRRSLSTGGVPVDVRHRPPRVARPEIVVLADVSGSVAAFARFTLQLLYALASQFSGVRTFVFVDGLDEVTRVFRRAGSIGEALATLALEADACGPEGHSDYGRALAVFHERYARGALSGRTTVIVAGDARSNYHPPRDDLLADIRRRARRVVWLNPEPRAYWGSGDSVIARYAQHCDALFECRNLRQLQAAVAALT